MERELAIAHDYFTQWGGAERVVETWLKTFPADRVYTLVSSDVRSRDLAAQRIAISEPLHGRARRAVAGRLEIAAPLLPWLARSVRVPDEYDVVLVSSSGFAHLLTTKVPMVVYFHTPARWLYASEDYLQGRGVLTRSMLALGTPLLSSIDRRGAARAAALVANGTSSQRRIKEAYGRDAPIVHPPVLPVSETLMPPKEILPEEFALVIARDRAYKGVGLAIEACESIRMPLVVVGSGSERYTADNILGLGRVSDPVLAWLYRRAACLLAVAKEDFGLTPVEAALEGTPTVAINAGGYRETVLPGQNGLLVAAEVHALGQAISDVVETNYNAGGVAATAERFSVSRHVDAMRAVIESVLA
ncbi:glycosyltransferase [Modestobacter lapidis]|nr:glycosyltransferase family 4 protein [Modestobacter lapidis]